jgi:hypothetical protein
LIPDEALKMIEEASSNPVQLQDSFTAYDECSSISAIWFISEIVFHMILIFSGYDDECVTAGEIYACGRQKEPTIVDAIFSTEKGNATVVWFQMVSLQSHFHYILNCHSTHHLYLALNIHAAVHTRASDPASLMLILF